MFNQLETEYTHFIPRCQNTLVYLLTIMPVAAYLGGLKGTCYYVWGH